MRALWLLMLAAGKAICVEGSLQGPIAVGGTHPKPPTAPMLSVELGLGSAEAARKSGGLGEKTNSKISARTLNPKGVAERTARLQPMHSPGSNCLKLQLMQA